MKKIVPVIIVLIICLSLCACGSNTEHDTKDIELCAEYTIEKMKEELKNPDSLIINSLYGVETEDSYIFAVKYSAQNGFGGTVEDNLFLDVQKLENGFSVRTYGSDSFLDTDNQKYTAQFFAKSKRSSGYFIFDTNTLLVSSFVESDANSGEAVELTGKLKGANESYEGAWNFQIGETSTLSLVYFDDSVDLSWYEKFQNSPYEITISAVLEDDSYHNATIVSDPVLDATDDEKFQRFNYYDRCYFKEYVKSQTAMTEDEIKNVLTDNSFKMRNNIGGDGDGTHTITFYAGGSLDSNYTSDGETYTMFDSWELRDGVVVLTNSFTNSFGEHKTSEHLLTPYKYDANRYLLIDESRDYSMILTVK